MANHIENRRFNANLQSSGRNGDHSGKGVEIFHGGSQPGEPAPGQKGRQIDGCEVSLDTESKTGDRQAATFIRPMLMIGALREIRKGGVRVGGRFRPAPRRPRNSIRSAGGEAGFSLIDSSKSYSFSFDQSDVWRRTSSSFLKQLKSIQQLGAVVEIPVGNR
ncbi:MAG: hypothetical protein ACLQE9_04120 [Roseiarcus sp.]